MRKPNEECHKLESIVIGMTAIKITLNYTTPSAGAAYTPQFEKSEIVLDISSFALLPFHLD